MAWFSDLAGKAENLLMNLDEQTGAALRNHSVLKQKKHDRHEYSHNVEPQWTPNKKKPIPRSLKTISRKPSPIARESVGHYIPVQPKESPTKYFKQKTRKPYNLNHCPRTLVDEMKNCEENAEPYGYKPRRYSLPLNLDEFDYDCIVNKLENLEVENEMLKNELNVTNREIKEMLERLHHMKDELSKTKQKLENADHTNRELVLQKETLSSQLTQLKAEISNLTNVEIHRFKEQKQKLETEITVLRERNADLEEMVKHLTEKNKERDSVCGKVENDLRHAHSTINVLQTDLQKSNDECRRLEKEWESYKHRVKSMLAAKDKEIRTLQQGVNLTEDTKVLIEQIEQLKEEREVLSEAVTRVRGECGDMKSYMENLESRHTAAERVVLALRDALKDERSARTRAESQCNALAKELKSIQIETGQTIANLRGALRDKEQEMDRIRETSTSSLRSTTDMSALNVADYDVGQDSEDSERLYQLSQKLVQKQGKIDMLIADNNMLKIQMDKLESKHKAELQALRAHSVVQLQESDRNRTRTGNPYTRWICGIARRYPIFRMFIIIYMVCLHFWVITVLLTSTPDSSKTYYRPVFTPQI